MKYQFIKIIGIMIFLAILIPGCCKKNRPPYAPYTPRGPANGLVSESYDFSSLAIDPNYDRLAIRFDWGNGDTSAWSQLVATDQIVTMSYSWTSPNTYHVKTQAKDQKDAYSEWSLPLFVTITIPESTYWSNSIMNSAKSSTR